MEVLDFDRFMSDIFTPESYAEEAKDLYDAGYPADECPPYMVIYETLHSVCEEQRNIVDSGVDLKMLSSAFTVLPQLTELSLSFCQTVEEEGWLESYLALDMTMTQKSYEHHVRVVSNAILSARKEVV